jgi:2,4-dienoyl-CoA reductase-like NADH-dependent reductase (Old Yellow Enzyme family)
MRFPLRVVDACVQVREKLNRPDFVIGYRLSPEEPFENGLTMTETLALVKELVKRPLQYIHISLQDYFREARRGEGAGTIRLKLIHEITQGKVALVGVGGLKTAEDFNKAINSGLSEFVAAGRAYIVNKSFSTLLKENRTDEIKVEIDSDHPEDYELAPMLWNIALTSHGWIPVKEKN